MKLRCGVLAILFKLFSYFAELSASSFSEEFASLPKIFFMNETDECPDHYYYCKFNIQLKPRDPDNPPEIWKLIKKQSAYTRDKIYRAVCSENMSIEQILQDELQPYNLKGEVTFSYCDHKSHFKELFGYNEFLLGLLFVSYSGFIAYCTIATYYFWNSVNNKYVKMFSLITIWKEIQEPNRNEDFNNLLCLQGIRTIGMLGVIGSHTLMFLMLLTFIRNPEYFEDVSDNLLFHLCRNCFNVVVQIFFVISAWLLAVQLNNTVRDKGELKLRDLALLWLNRYLRFIPAVLVILAICSSESLVPLISHPFYYSFLRKEIELCRSDWWKNLLFFQNIQSGNERMCQPVMWYIAADLQMYLIVSTLFYLSKKFNISLKYLLSSMAVVTVSIQLYDAFMTTEFRRLLRITPRFSNLFLLFFWGFLRSRSGRRLLPIEESLNTPKIFVTYFKTYGSCVTYIVGFTFGTIYFHNKGKTIFNTTMKKLFFYASFLCLPLLCCYLQGNEFNDFVNTLMIVVSIRPLFGLGIAIGILGMATGTGGIVKKFLESKVMVYFGSFTYSIYMFHTFNISARTFLFPKYVEVTNYYSVMTYILDVILSFAFGIFMYIVLEHPLMKLQKQLIPQMSRKKKEGYKKE